MPQMVRATEGDRVQLSALYFDASGIPIRDADVEWSVDADLAEVDGEGRLNVVGAPGRYPDAITASVPSLDGQHIDLHATLVILGELARVEVHPSRISLESGAAVLLSALAFDSANNRLFDVSFSWRLAAGTPGTIASSGLYVAGDRPGEYRGGLVVRGAQQ